MIKVTTAKHRKVTKIRKTIAERSKIRLSVNKTPRHIYCQVFSPDGSEVIASASSLDKEIRGKDFGKGKMELAKAVGALAATRAKSRGVTAVAFDRSGFKYHGRIKALADGAREQGLEF